VALALLLLVVFMASFWERWLTVHYLFAEAARFRNDTDLMRYLHVRNSPQEIPLRADDPVRGGGAATRTLVVFSDFQCPACRRFAAFYKREIQPVYGDRLRLVYKHLPLDSECNPPFPKALHPNACEAAYAAEAARELAGAEGFWKMHDALFERAADVDAGRWAEVATGAGLDGAAVAERVAQRKHLDRIQEDTRIAVDLKLRGTPSIFIDGRLLEDWTRPDLWKAILEAPDAPLAIVVADPVPAAP
jgi:protein-disulfide isomerase